MTFTMPRLRRAPGPVQAAETPQAARADSDPASVTAVQPAAPADAGPLPAGHALTRPDGGRVNPFIQCLMFARIKVRAARRRAREASAREGNWLSGFLAAKPRSVNEQRGYLANRRWLEPGHEGGIVDRAGEAYQVAYGIPGVALCNAGSLTFKHAYRFTGVTAVLLVTLFAACKFVLHLPAGTSIAVPGVLAAILAGWWLLVFAVLAGRRAFAQWRAER
jgi:hypothetical protein